MPSPVRAELQQALSELRLAAEALKTYDADAAERLGALVAKHGQTVRATTGLTGEAASLHERAVAHMEAIPECIARTKQYPAQIIGRANLLDRASGLAKMSRLLLAKLIPPHLR